MYFKPALTYHVETKKTAGFRQQNVEENQKRQNEQNANQENSWVDKMEGSKITSRQESEHGEDCLDKQQYIKNSRDTAKKKIMLWMEQKIKEIENRGINWLELLRE